MAQDIAPQFAVRTSTRCCRSSAPSVLMLCDTHDSKGYQIDELPLVTEYRKNSSLDWLRCQRSVSGQFQRVISY